MPRYATPDLAPLGGGDGNLFHRLARTSAAMLRRGDDAAGRPDPGLMPDGLTPRQQAEWQKCRDDAVHFIRSHCQIELDDGMGGLVWGRFALWPDQEVAARHLDKAKKAAAVKARQQGFTWLALALALHRMVFRPVASVLMFSKTDDDAKEMARRLGAMWDRLSPGIKPAGRANTEEVKLANGSRAISFSTKGGRSRTGTLAVVDEADFIPDLQRLLDAVKPTVDAGGQLWLISTSDKDQPVSLFKKIWRAGRAGRNGYLSLFYSWRMRPTRSQEWYDRERRESFETTGSYDHVQQEYPETVEEAFAPRELSARIPPAWVERCWAELAPLPFHADAAVRDPALAAVGLESDAPFVPGMSVWRLPEPGRRYVIGSDPSEGQPGSHESPIQVLAHDDGEQVAMLPGPVPMDLLGHYIALLSRWYGGASVLVERNNHGHAVLLWLRDNAPDVYVLLGPDGKPGWLEGQRQKILLYDKAAVRLRRGECRIHDEQTKAQLCTVEANTLRAPEGLPDDRAMSFVIACMAIESTPRGRYEIR